MRYWASIPCSPKLRSLQAPRNPKPSTLLQSRRKHLGQQWRGSHNTRTRTGFISLPFVCLFLWSGEVHVLPLTSESVCSRSGRREGRQWLILNDCTQSHVEHLRNYYIFLTVWKSVYWKRKLFTERKLWQISDLKLSSMKYIVDSAQLWCLRDFFIEDVQWYRFLNVLFSLFLQRKHFIWLIEREDIFYNCIIQCMEARVWPVLFFLYCVWMCHDVYLNS